MNVHIKLCTHLVRKVIALKIARLRSLYLLCK